MRTLTLEVFHIREPSVQSLKDSTRSSTDLSQSSAHSNEFWQRFGKIIGK